MNAMVKSKSVKRSRWLWPKSLADHPGAQPCKRDARWLPEWVFDNAISHKQRIISKERQGLRNLHTIEAICQRSQLHVPDDLYTTPSALFHLCCCSGVKFKDFLQIFANGKIHRLFQNLEFLFQFQRFSMLTKTRGNHVVVGVVRVKKWNHKLVNILEVILKK